MNDGNWYRVNADAGYLVKDVSALRQDHVAYSDYNHNVFISEGFGI